MVERFGYNKHIGKRENSFNELSKLPIFGSGLILFFLLGVFKPWPDYFVQVMMVSLVFVFFIPSKVLKLIFPNRKVDLYIKEAKQYSSKKKMFYVFTYWLLLFLFIILFLASIVFFAVSYRDN